jgi:hypothetical protein
MYTCTEIVSAISEYLDAAIYNLFGLYFLFVGTRGFD